MLKEIKVQSPGRINIIGEHTDYNGGFVLPAAIDKAMYVDLKRNSTDFIINVNAIDLNEQFTINLNQLNKIESGWQNYIIGVIHEIKLLNPNITGFDLSFGGTVPIGSGMSSSAALECSVAYGINQLFDLKIDKEKIIEACQRAEHNFVGTKCGIMDQFASVMGKKNHAILLDCLTLEYEYYPIDLGQYEILLLNTNVSHNLANSEYNLRREDCENALKIIKHNIPNVNSFRDLNLEQIVSIKEKLGDIGFKRSKHVISENERVLNATKALQNKNIDELGSLMYLSHKSLSNDYQVSCKELDFLVDQTKDLDYILGSRMMGGGFGGCTISIINKKYTDQFIELVSKKYVNEFGLDLSPYDVSIENGTSIIK